MKLTITGQVSCGKNAIQTTRSGQRYPTQAFKTWRDSALTQIWQQEGYIHEIKLFDEPLHITYDYWPGDRRIRDATAVQDAVDHVLEKAGVVTNDKWFEHLSYIKHQIDKDFPRIVLTIYALAGGD